MANIDFSTSQIGSEGVFYIGTSAGIVVVYNVIYNTIAKLELTYKYKPSPVTCIKLSTNLNYLLVGQESGEIIIWDLQRHLAVQTIAFGDNAAILTFAVIKMDLLSFVVSNSAGRVYLITGSKTLFGETTYSQTLLLNKSLGAAVDLKVIEFHRPKAEDQESIDCHLLALATLSKVVILVFSPEPRVVGTFCVSDYNETDTSFPYIAWGWVQSQVYEFIGLAIA